MPKRIARRVMLIGWDAADWAFINPLMERGHMPNLKRLIEGGVMGKIGTLAPMLSPMLWNSIATGKLGHKHGILGFVEPDPKGFARPVTSTSRKAKALWNILSQNDMRSCVVGWFASHPAERINGAVFTDRFEQVVGEKATHFPLDPAAIHPGELFETAKKLQVHPDELHESQVLPFVPLADRVDQDKDNRIALIAKTLAEGTTIHNAATYLAENERWDLLAVYYDMIDHMGHGFMEYNPPKMDHVKQEDFEVYQYVMATTYMYHDLMLGRLVQLGGPETTYVVLSDHGFHHADLRPKYFVHPDDPAKQIGPALDPLAWHRRYGIVVMNGPGIKKDELVHGMTLLDVCPTILAMLGLPVARDMDGKVMTQVFTEPPALEHVETYEGEHPKDGVYRGEYAEDPYAALAAMQQLIDLGYVEKPSEDNAKWLHDHTNDRKNVMAHVLYSVGKFAECERLLRELLAEYPTPGLACRLIMSLLEQRKLDEAERMAEETASLREDMPLFMMLQGQIKFQKGDFDEAFALFEKVRESDPKSHQVHLLLGQIHVSKKRWEMAEDAFRRVLAAEPDHAEAHDGLGVALAGQGKLEDGVFHLMQSAALVHERWLTHYNLALVLLDLDRVDWAIRALETASELAPDNPEPHRVLARVYRVRKNDVENSLKHMRLLAEKRAKAEGVQPAAAGDGDGEGGAIAAAAPAPAN